MIAALAACSGSDNGRTSTTPLASDGTHLRDASGRVAILRGVNARVDGVFDVTFSDGRIPLEPIPPLTTEDCTRMRRLGFDLLRLPINWSGVEPERGQYDESYLARVDAAIQCAGAAGIYVLVDLHQDGYSKEIGEDGAPLWAIDPPPTTLLQGPLDDLGARRVSAQVQDAFRTFFALDDASGLQAEFATMLTHVAARWADDPHVLGFEIFNEPDTGEANVDAFQANAAAAVRAAAPHKLVMFEPAALRNITDFVPKPTHPFPDPAAVYSPHIYTYVFQSDQTAFTNATIDQLESSVAAARAEADAWKTPLLVGEFGCGPTDDAAHNRWMQSEAQLFDRYFASSAFWVWKEQSQASWGIYDYGGGTTWTERPLVVSWVSRVHVARIAGTPTVLESNPAGDTIHLEISDAVDAPNEVYIPERFTSATATCDGAMTTLTPDPATGLAEVSCGGTLDVTAR